MTFDETFADPVVVPGPNLRSLFVDTEDVEDVVTEQVDEHGSRFCHPAFPSREVICSGDETWLVELPPSGDSDPGH